MATALSFFLFFMPVPVSAIADDSDDASFYLNWWVEEHTGINMKDIPVTAYGMSYADYIYRQTGYTIDYWVDNATNPSNFGENTDEYLQNTLYNDSELMKDLLSTTPITNTTSQVYGTNYNDRVNSDGDINVSGSNYWNSVYNNLSHKGYKDQYIPSDNDSYTGNVNGHTFQLNWFGICSVDGTDIDNPAPDVLYIPSSERFCTSLHKQDAYWGNTTGLSCSIDGQQYYIYTAATHNGWFGSYNGLTISGNTYYFNFSWTGMSGSSYNDSMVVYFTDSVNNPGTENVPVKQPYQVGYINYNGNKVPVYTDPSKNPFTINPNGTVSYDNDPTEYPIYIDPDELSPDGDLILLQYIVNNYYGNDNNNFDPFSNDPNNRLNYPDSNSKDYTEGFNSIIAWLKKIYNKETDIIKYLKQIAKGIPLSDDNDSEDDSDKFDTFESMLKLFNGSNNDGFKQKILGKIGYAGITQNINNFGMALFGSRTFNDDGTVNTQFGSNSVTETPTLYYTYAGVTHNFWNDLQLINANGDLTKAKEYVRFFIIFGFFLSLFRSLPSLINNAGGILSHASLAVPVDQSESSIELTEINQILADAPYPDEF